MRFQTNHMVEAADADLVLSTLERNLLGLSLKITRSANVIRAYGIGPSPRPINVHNTSTFRAEAGQAGRILLTGDVEFQASALMDGAAQIPEVRSKIENAIRLTQAEVASEEIAAAAVATPDRAVTAVPAAVAPVRTLERRDAPALSSLARLQAQTDAEPLRNRAEARYVDERRLPQKSLDRVPGELWQHRGSLAAAGMLVLLAATYLFGRFQGRDSAEVAEPPRLVDKAAPPLVPTPEEQLQDDYAVPPPVAKSIKPAEATTQSPQASGGQGSKLRRQGAPALADSGATAATIAELREPVVAAPTWTSGERVPPVLRAATTSTGNTGARPVAADAALGDRLEQWAASMRSTNPVQQASFYAGHLDRYFLKTDVSHDFVLRDKEEFLRRGKRVERFDLQDVALEEQTDFAAKIRLVKHYVVLAARAGPASEKLVRSELNLRKVDGAWEITGERDFK